LIGFVLQGPLSGIRSPFHYKNPLCGRVAPQLLP